MLVVSVAALTGCQKEPPPKVEAPRPVRSMVVQPTVLQDQLILPAEIRPRIEIRYGFRVGGKVAQRLVSVGDRVQAGQILARLDPQDVAPAIASARASLDAARTDEKLALTELNRLRELRERNYISQAQLDRQQATHDAAGSRTRSAQAQLTQAGNTLDFQVLRADVAGVVLGVEAEAGQVLAAGQTAIRVARTGELEALVNVPEKDMALARQAPAWTVQIPALAGRTLSAKLRELSPVSDAASRTYPMRLILTGDLDGVAIGMTALVMAPVAREPGLVLPISALYSKDGQPHVWLIDAGARTVKTVPVRTAGLTEDSVRILSGIQAGDRVVTAGANLLVQGQAIKLVDPVAQAK